MTPRSSCPGEEPIPLLGADLRLNYEQHSNAKAICSGCRRRTSTRADSSVMARHAPRGTFAHSVLSNEDVTPTHNRFILVALVAVIPLAVGAVVSFRLWPVPKLSPSWPPRTPGSPELGLADKDAQKPCPSVKEQQLPVQTTVCDVVQHPKEFDCKRIRIRAELTTDCMHGSVLVDNGCTRGIAPSGSPDPAVDAFFEAACEGRPIDFGAKRTATFTGRLRSPVNDQKSPFVLEIETIRDVKIAPTRKGKASPSPRDRTP